MVSTFLMTDTISLLKKDGCRFDDIQAHVKKNKIRICHTHIVIDPGDVVLRKFKTGREWAYQVIDPGFHENFYGILAGYQMEVKKLSNNETLRTQQSMLNSSCDYW